MTFVRSLPCMRRGPYRQIPVVRLESLVHHTRRAQPFQTRSWADIFRTFTGPVFFDNSRKHTPRRFQVFQNVYTPPQTGWAKKSNAGRPNASSRVQRQLTCPASDNYLGRLIL